MPNSPAPTGILINSRSLYGFHKQYVKALDWSPTPDTNGAGFLNTWDSAGIDTDDAVQAFVTALCPFFPTSYSWQNYVVFTYPTPESQPEPMASGTLTQVGTSATPGWSKAVQITISLRTSLFGQARIVLLDADSQDNYDKSTIVPGASPLETLINLFTDDANPWSGQDNGQPQTYLSSTVTLNEKLRRAYRMT